MRKTSYSLCLTFILILASGDLYAQFEESKFEKITKDEWTWFTTKFADISWTGRGLNRQTAIDKKKTHVLRARMQAVFGDPTKTIEDLINTTGFRPAEAIEFEYWFTVDDSIPLMILDIDGPFGQGLVYGGASRYIDLMPQIKRTLSKKIMGVDQLANFQDYFYSPEREQWFNVVYENGEHKTTRIESPEGMIIDYDY